MIATQYETWTDEIALEIFMADATRVLLLLADPLRNLQTHSRERPHWRPHAGCIAGTPPPSIRQLLALTRNFGNSTRLLLMTFF
jgi:hypothetical protein